ncbi:MAG: peptidase M2 family protein, partial [Alteromonadales bacterium]|nr:peptidase M2 family protein [Alteromonadales bacterium]
MKQIKNTFKLTGLALVIAASLTACSQGTGQQASTDKMTGVSTHSVLTAADAQIFLDDVAKEMVTLNLEGSRAAWIYANFITEDTASLVAEADQKSTDAGVRFAMQAARFDDVEVNATQRRQLNFLKQSLVMPAPQDSEKSAELANIGAKLGSIYGKGSYTTKAGKKFSLGDMTSTMANSRDYDELLEMWSGWREISPEMKPLYTRQAELANEGAKGLGYKDLGAMWRSNYDMPADDFAKELDRLWGQVKPLYDDLHCYVRSELAETYGTDKVAQDKPIPAHLLGNMWAQSWGNIYDLVAPEDADPGYDVTKQLAANNYDEI